VRYEVVKDAATKTVLWGVWL